MATAAVLPATSVDDEATRMFRQQWNTYQKVLEGDHLEHTLLYKVVESTLEQKAQTGPLDALDLGCGDADYVSRLLSRTSLPLLRSYTGVDLSRPALEVARGNLTRQAPGLGLRAAPDTAASFHHADLLSYARDATADYDVILMSFSLHHLATEAKGQVLQEAHRLLAKRKGVCLLVDVVCHEGEARDAYLRRATADVDQNWACLEPERKVTVKAHITSCDFPESVSCYQAMGQRAGFSEAECAVCGKNDLATVMVYRA